MLIVNDIIAPKTRLKLQKIAEIHKERANQGGTKEDNQIFRDLPPIFFEYQAKFSKAFDNPENKILIWEKARRIGATHAIAAIAVLEASKKGGKNFFYIGTNLSMAKEFLDSCAYWAKSFQLVSTKIGEELYQDEDKDILALKIKFKSGKKIAALSSKPSSIRGLQGHVLLDESAFVDNLDEFLKAIKAMLVWGNKVMVVSTHDGVDNPFNVLCEEVKKGNLHYYIQKTTFRDAIEDGLYKRICLCLGEEWTLEKEFEWIKDIYKQYGSGASEELDVIPSEASVNAIFKKSDFKQIDERELPTSFDYIVLAFDTAATNKSQSCFTVGTVLGKLQDSIFILDACWIRDNPLKTQEFIIKVIKKHPKVPVFIEQEGGSQSLLWFENSLKPSLPDRKIIGVTPSGDKSLRAIPVAEKVKEGLVYVKRARWTDEYLDNLKKFDGTPGIPLVTDLGDSLSLAYQQVAKGLKGVFDNKSMGTVVNRKKR